MSAARDPEIVELLARNVAWARQRTLPDLDDVRRLVALQAPQVFGIGCADGRVPAKIITGLEPGTVFVRSPRRRPRACRGARRDLDVTTGAG